jgi:ubiquinone/menaquinone biosynthesis C-methylase UbiE
MNALGFGRFIEPEAVVSHLHLKSGDIIADFGAGSGFFLSPLSAAVGPQGRVFACEIQKNLVEALTEYARARNLGNVQPLWCDLEEPGGIKLADGQLDAALLINTLFLIEDKDAAVTEMLRTVRRGGSFFVIDWTESFGGMGPQSAQVVTATATTDLFESHHCSLEREFAAGDHHYGLAFRKL